MAMSLLMGVFVIYFVMNPLFTVLGFILMKVKRK